MKVHVDNINSMKLSFENISGESCKCVFIIMHNDGDMNYESMKLDYHAIYKTEVK